MEKIARTTRRAVVFSLASVGATLAAGAATPSPRPESRALVEAFGCPQAHQAPEVGLDLSTGTRRTPWLGHRISRGFFSPIGRPPHDRDELADDVDYYPVSYLERLRREGVNGIWVSVSFRDLATTSFGPPRRRDAPQRLAKLCRTVEKCGRSGIRVWILGNEPAAENPADALFVAYPDCMGARFDWTDRVCWCPTSPTTRAYLEESAYSIFSQVPGLAGLINISHGEGLTTCLSAIPSSDVSWTPVACPRCASREPWELHADAVSALLRGIRRADPAAEVISWFYEPEPSPTRREWVYEVPRHVPEGVTFMYNFESGAVKRQLGRWRVGGDYWLSFPGPAAPFSRLAQVARLSGTTLGAKIQMASSHEVATVPFVPAPGLLYRKFRGMRESGVRHVLLSWFFGNAPGVMNRAAGELAYSDFSESEEAFLLRLAKGEWGEDAAAVADLWKRFSDAYENYPLANNVQYYGPFAAGVVWPLVADLGLKGLPMSWVPMSGDHPYGGDAIGESIPGFSLDEVLVLADRLAQGTDGRDVTGADVLSALRAKYANDRERAQDLGVMRMLHLLFAQGADIFRFYRLRSEAIYRSRVTGESARALGAIAEMRAVVARAVSYTDETKALCLSDARLGFHSEAETHLFSPTLLDERLRGLAKTAARLDEIAAAVAAGAGYPESDFERSAAKARPGVWADGKGLRWKAERTCDGGLDLSVEYGALPDSLIVTLFDAAGTQFPIRVLVRKGGEIVAFPQEACSGSCRMEGTTHTLALRFPAGAWGGDDRLFPTWLCFVSDAYPQRAQADVLWPNAGRRLRNRLNLNWVQGDVCGRLLRK